MRAGVHSHLRSLEHIEGVDVAFVNAYAPLPRLVARARPDAIVLHNTFLCLRWSHMFPTWKWGLRWVSEADCPKIALPQDEYDHAHVLDEWLAELGVSLVVSNFGEDARADLYPLLRDRVPFVKRFTGYLDEDTAAAVRSRLLPHAVRRLDVAYRASHLPYWFGSHGQLKHEVGSVVDERGAHFGLRTDISTQPGAAILGEAWLDFLASSRVVLGCESGSSVLDRRGEIRAAIQALLAKDPELTFGDVDSLMPAGWDDYRFFAISPRHFEAVATKTCQVLVEGEYDGVLEANKHYIPLARDFSNLDTVLAAIADPEVTSEIAEQAYRDVYLSGRYGYDALRDAVVDVLDAAPRRDSGPLASLAVFLAEHPPSVSRPLRRLPRLRRSPLVGDALRLVAVARFSTRPAARTLLRLYRQLDEPPPLRRMFADALRLAVLEEICATPAPPFTVEPEVRSDTLVLRSRPANGRPANRHADEIREAVRTVERVIWDHSGVGSAATAAVGPLRVAVGMQRQLGAYELASLRPLLTEFPTETADLLVGVLLPRNVTRAGD